MPIKVCVYRMIYKNGLPSLVLFLYGIPSVTQFRLNLDHWRVSLFGRNSYWLLYFCGLSLARIKRPLADKTHSTLIEKLNKLFCCCLFIVVLLFAVVSFRKLTKTHAQLGYFTFQSYCGERTRAEFGMAKTISPLNLMDKNKIRARRQYLHLVEGRT